MNEILAAENISNNEKYCLLFSLNDKVYGIDVEYILEIINIPKLDVPQKMPKHVLGTITYNKTSIKIIDLCSMLNRKSKQYSLDAQIIITKIGNSLFGLVIDKAINVHVMRQKYIQPLPYHSKDDLIQFLYRIKDAFISILDTTAINNLIKKSQLDAGDITAEDVLPNDEESLNTLALRQQELIKKFANNVPQVYYRQEQYIEFTLGQNFYAISINHVKEIVKVKNVSLVKLPSKQDFLEGIFNLRGDFISVYNFAKFLQIPPEALEPINNMLIVLQLKDFKIALLVDEIQDIITVNSNEINSQINKKFESRYISNEIHLNEHVISVVNIDKLMSDDRLYIKD